MNSFDDHAKNYSASMDKLAGRMGQDHDVFIAFKARLLTRLLRRNLGDPRQARVLDVGCGVGLIDSHLVGQVGKLRGIDISAESVRIAVDKCPGADFLTYDGKRIPYDDAQFDLAFACCVFHHIPPADWHSVAAEMARVLRPGGLAIIIEHNPLNPVTSHVVRTCWMDEGAVLLRAGTCMRLMRQAGFRVKQKKYITFFPFQIPAMDFIEGLLGWLPFGAQYFVASAKPAP